MTVMVAGPNKLAKNPATDEDVKLLVPDGTDALGEDGVVYLRRRRGISTDNMIIMLMFMLCLFAVLMIAALALLVFKQGKESGRRSCSLHHDMDGFEDPQNMEDRYMPLPEGVMVKPFIDPNLKKDKKTFEFQFQRTDQDFNEQFYEEHVVPMPWTVFPNPGSPPKMVLMLSNVAADSMLNNMLREILEIGGRVEKIEVFRDGNNVTFIHDFGQNVTGIVDSARCYVTDLDFPLVFEPSVLLNSIESGSSFDVTRVRSRLRAVIPSEPTDAQRSVIGERCSKKPVYQLESITNAIRKRSADEPAPDYIHFSGKHVQEIRIDNLADVLEHEKTK